MGRSQIYKLLSGCSPWPLTASLQLPVSVKASYDQNPEPVVTTMPTECSMAPAVCESRVKWTLRGDTILRSYGYSLVEKGFEQRGTVFGTM